MIFINYTFGINSMRMTGEEIKVNMAYRWTKPKEEWIKDINPIIVGKINYYLNVYKVLKVFEGHMHRNKVDMEKRIQKIQRTRYSILHKKEIKENGRFFIKIVRT